jgi:plasmid stabilization system protein ParE
MAKKIEWTESSLRDRVSIYQFGLDRNKSEIYSQKLETLFKEAANLISQFPEVGIETDFPELRIKVIRQYKLFYFNREDSNPNYQGLGLKTKSLLVGPIINKAHTSLTRNMI